MPEGKNIETRKIVSGQKVLNETKYFFFLFFFQKSGQIFPSRYYDRPIKRSRAVTIVIRGTSKNKINRYFLFLLLCRRDTVRAYVFRRRSYINHVRTAFPRSPGYNIITLVVKYMCCSQNARLTTTKFNFFSGENHMHK